VLAASCIDRPATQALYELPDEKVTPEEVMALADSVEADIQGGPAGRPLLAVPHILADDASLVPHAHLCRIIYIEDHAPASPAHCTWPANVALHHAACAHIINCAPLPLLTLSGVFCCTEQRVLPCVRDGRDERAPDAGALQPHPRRNRGPA
jgi:hypothetical protein